MARAQGSRAGEANSDLKIGGMVNQDYTQAVQGLRNSVSGYSLAHAEADEEFSLVCRDFNFLFPPQGDVGQDGSNSGSQVIDNCQDKIKKYNELYDLQVKILSLDKELGSPAKSEPVGISAVAFAWISSWWDSTATAQPGLRERHAKAQREAQYPVKIRKNLRNVFFLAIVLTGIVVTTFIFIAKFTAQSLLAALAGSPVLLPILAVFFLMLVLSSRAYPQYKQYKLKQLADKLGAEVREKETDFRIKSVKYQYLLGEWFPSQPTVEEKIKQDATARKNSVQDRFVDGLTAIDQGRVSARENAQLQCNAALASLDNLGRNIGDAETPSFDRAVYNRIMRVGHDINNFFNLDGDQALDSLAHCMARLDRCRDIIRRSYQIHEMLSTYEGYGMTDTLLHDVIGRKEKRQRKAIIIQRMWRQRNMASREGQATGSQPEVMRSKEVLEQFADSIHGRVSALNDDVVKAFSPSDGHRMPLQAISPPLLQRLVTRSRDKYVQPHAAVDDPVEQALAERYAVILNQVEGYKEWFSVISEQIDRLRQSIDDLKYQAGEAVKSVTRIVRKLGGEPLNDYREATSRVITMVSVVSEVNVQAALPTLEGMIGPQLSDYDVLRARTKNAQDYIESVTEQLKKYNVLIEQHKESKNLTFVVKALKSKYLDDMSTICSDYSDEDGAAQQFVRLNAMADLSLSVLTQDDAPINGYLQKLDRLEEGTEGTVSRETEATLNTLFHLIAQKFREQYLSLLRWDDSTAAVTEHAEQLRKINEQVVNMTKLRSSIIYQLKRIHSLSNNKHIKPVMQALEETYLHNLFSVVSDVGDLSSLKLDVAEKMMREQHLKIQEVFELRDRRFNVGFLFVSYDFEKLETLENKLEADPFVQVVQAFQQKYQQALVEAVKIGEKSSVVAVVMEHRPIVGTLQAYNEQLKQVMALQVKREKLRTHIGELSANTRYRSDDLQLPEVTLDDIKQGTVLERFKGIEKLADVIKSELERLEECQKFLRTINLILQSPEVKQRILEEGSEAHALNCMYEKNICRPLWQKDPVDLLEQLKEFQGNMVAFQRKCTVEDGRNARSEEGGDRSSYEEGQDADESVTKAVYSYLSSQFHQCHIFARQRQPQGGDSLSRQFIVKKQQLNRGYPSASEGVDSAVSGAAEKSTEKKSSASGGHTFSR